MASKEIDVPHGKSKSIRYGVKGCNNIWKYTSTTWSITDSSDFSGISINGSAVNGVKISTNSSTGVLTCSNNSTSTDDKYITVKATSLGNCSSDCEFTIKGKEEVITYKWYFSEDGWVNSVVETTSVSMTIYENDFGSWGNGGFAAIFCCYENPVELGSNYCWGTYTIQNTKTINVGGKTWGLSDLRYDLNKGICFKTPSTLVTDLNNLTSSFEYSITGNVLAQYLTLPVSITYKKQVTVTEYKVFIDVQVTFDIDYVNSLTCNDSDTTAVDLTVDVTCNEDSNIKYTFDYPAIPSQYSGGGSSEEFKTTATSLSGGVNISLAPGGQKMIILNNSIIINNDGGDNSGRKDFSGGNGYMCNNTVTKYYEYSNMSVSQTWSHSNMNDTTIKINIYIG